MPYYACVYVQYILHKHTHTIETGKVTEITCLVIAIHNYWQQQRNFEMVLKLFRMVLTNKKFVPKFWGC